MASFKREGLKEDDAVRTPRRVLSSQGVSQCAPVGCPVVTQHTVPRDITGQRPGMLRAKVTSLAPSQKAAQHLQSIMLTALSPQHQAGKRTVRGRVIAPFKRES